MPNFKSVVHFLLVDFGEGYLLVSCDGGQGEYFSESVDKPSGKSFSIWAGSGRVSYFDNSHVLS